MEIESKYTVPDEATFSTLLGLRSLGEYSLHPGRNQRLVDHYYDTAGGALRRGGWACRLREVRGRWLATVKALSQADGALHRREEYEFDLAGLALPDDWPPGPARDLVLAAAGAAPLSELFAIRQRRATRSVWHPTPRRRVAELALDVVELEAASGEKDCYRELEIELVEDGSLADLEALGAALEPFGLEAQPHSKFERALGWQAAAAEHAQAEPEAEPPAPARPKSPGVRADEPMAEAGRKVLRFHFERMLAQEAGAREGVDPEALHAMRVATRRQRAAFRVFGPYFKPKTIRPLLRELKALADDLGAVRDLDVLLEAARGYQVDLPAGETRALQPLLEEWEQQREAARARLIAYLEGEDYGAFLKSYRDFVDTEGSGVKTRAAELPEPRLVRHKLPGQVWDHYAALRAYETVLPWAPIDVLHAGRIEAKRLRYLLEFFRDVLPDGTRAAIDHLVALQDHLGELNDAHVTIGLLQDFLMRPPGLTLKASVREAVGRYLEVKQTRLRQLQRTASRPWRRVMGRPFRQLLARAAAEL